MCFVHELLSVYWCTNVVRIRKKIKRYPEAADVVSFGTVWVILIFIMDRYIISPKLTSLVATREQLFWLGQISITQESFNNSLPQSLNKCLKLPVIQDYFLPHCCSSIIGDLKYKHFFIKQFYKWFLHTFSMICTGFTVKLMSHVVPLSKVHTREWLERCFFKISCNWLGLLCVFKSNTFTFSILLMLTLIEGINPSSRLSIPSSADDLAV